MNKEDILKEIREELEKGIAREAREEELEFLDMLFHNPKTWGLWVAKRIKQIEKELGEIKE